MLLHFSDRKSSQCRQRVEAGRDPRAPFLEECKALQFLGGLISGLQVPTLKACSPVGTFRAEHPGKETRSNCWLQESGQSAESRWTLDFGLHLPRGWGQVELGR